MTAKAASSGKCECGGPKGDCHYGVTQDECEHDRVVTSKVMGREECFCHGCGRHWVPSEPAIGKGVKSKKMARQVRRVW